MTNPYHRFITMLGLLGLAATIVGNATGDPGSVTTGVIFGSFVALYAVVVLALHLRSIRKSS